MSKQIRRFVSKRVIVVLGLMLFLAWFLWTMWATYRANNLGFSSKTLWDWMELLIIPGVLSTGVWWLNRSEKQLELRIARERTETDQKIAQERLQEANIQDYLDRMEKLLIESKLRKSFEDDEVRSIARSRTLTILRTLDPTRKGILLRFLFESELISHSNKVIYLKDADMSEIDLTKSDLRAIPSPI